MSDVLSIEDRLRARLDAKTAHNTEVLPVDGFDDMFAARYNAITYRALRKINRQHERVEDEDEAELLVAADILVEACEEVYAVDPETGEREALGVPWSVELAHRLGLSHVQNARQCVLAIFVDDLDLITHRNRYFEFRDRAAIEAAKDIAGNSAT